MGITDTWGAVQVPRRRTSWAASVARQQSARFLVERAKPCEAITTIKTSALARRMLIEYPEEETFKRVVGVIRMLIASDAEAANIRWSPNATRIMAGRPHLAIRRMFADTSHRPLTTEERLQQVEGRIRSLSEGINEMLQTMTSQTEAAIRLVQKHRAKWQGDVVVEKRK